MHATTTQPGFHAIDWAILIGYLVLVIAIGLLAARKRREGDDFFLADRTMPMWAVAVSILATAQSAATFVGGPQEAYLGNLTYLATSIGPIIAAVIVGFLFLPRFYRHNVTSVYELIGHELGATSQRTASAMFMIGRVFASGARLFIVAIPFSLVAFGDVEPKHLALSIVIITIVATMYSIAGGIRAVIWTDVMQVVVYLSCVLIALVLIWQKIPASAGDIIHTLRDDEKLILFDFSFDLTKRYTVWASLIGITLLMIAAYGADQDLTQRMLTCRTPRKATWSVITATLLGLPVVFIFLAMGLLLYVYFQKPELMMIDPEQQRAVDDSRQVFLNFIISDMPTGLRGLMMAGLFAAAMSSMDSSLNAMSSTTIADFVRPLRAAYRYSAKQTDSPETLASSHPSTTGDRIERRIARIASLFWAIMLGGFALICIYWQQQADQTLIAFALGVMTFAYSGLLGVFFTALFTRRGNAASAVAAMITGFLCVLALDPAVWPLWPQIVQSLPGFAGNATLLSWFDAPLDFAWRLTIAALASFAVCASVPRRS